MERKTIIVVLTLLLVGSADSSAQGFLGGLGKKVLERAKQKVEEKVEQKVDEKVGKAADRILNGDFGTSDGDAAAEAAAGEADPQTATSSDFKRGSVVMFEDDVTGETVGEFPSKWDLLDGGAEVKTIGGQKAIEVTNNGVITPLLKQEGAYLPEEFTIEYDFYYWAQKDDVGLNDLKLCLANDADRSSWSGDNGSRAAFVLVHGVCDTSDQHYAFNNGSGSDETRDAGFTHQFKQGWHHVALSFNKRALKVYFDGKRVVNLPRVQQPTWFSFQVPYEYTNLTFIRNVVLAKGAVELYDRNAQDLSAVEKAIAETGKFVTNNILFDTGKATLKQESMIEIMRVADYMKKNPTARFEVQGHTDNQGSDKINDPLSQQRAEAIVKALEGLGVDGFNLKAVGKGSHEPVADNSTEEGRAKNRRVEFVKK